MWSVWVLADQLHCGIWSPDLSMLSNMLSSWWRQKLQILSLGWRLELAKAEGRVPRYGVEAE